MLKTHVMFILLALAGLAFAGCPNYQHECSNCGHIWCEDNLVVECVCYENADGPSDSVIEPLDDCSATGLTCAQLVDPVGDYPAQSGYNAGDARCLDLCVNRGQAVCRGEGNMASWWVCSVAYYGDTWGPDLWDLQEDVAVWLETDGQPNPPPTDKALAWRDSELPCIPCASSCGCPDKMVCTNGYCIKGELPKGLACCGREKGAPCPKDQACEHADGSAGVCQTAGWCEPCQEDLDCENQGMTCHSTGAGVDPVCMGWGDRSQLDLECRDDLNQVWKKDACDAWVAPALNCGDDEYCQGGACYTKQPELEIAPALLNFGDVAISDSKELTLSIGNPGLATLSVTDIELQEPTPGLFQLSQTSLDVEPDKIAEVTVTFTPTAVEEINAKLIIHSNDPDEPEINVLMSGAGQ